MKALLVLLVFVLFIFVLAGGSLESTDLTPDSAIIPGSSATIGPQTFQSAGSGSCGSSYTVQSGDTLFRIAQTCQTTVQSLLDYNPSITNANLIKPGDVIAIYYPVATYTPPAPGLPVAPTQAAQPALVQPQSITATPIKAINDTGMQGLSPGDTMTMEAYNFPPVAKIEVKIGPVGGPMETVKEVQTDRSGYYKAEIGIPPTAKPGETWIVTISTVEAPVMTIQSEPFVIE